MSTTIKNIIVAFTVVCAFAFAVFLIQLLVLNSGTDGDDKGSPPLNSVSSPDDETPSPWKPTTSGNTQPDAETASGSPETSDGGDLEGSQPEPEGTLYSFEMPGGMALTLFVKEETQEQQFSFIEPDDPDSEDELGTLDFNGNGKAALELRYVFVKESVREYAEESLDKYIESGGTSVLGETPIRGSGLRGVAVTGTLDRLTYEGWIYSFEDIGFNDVGFEIVIYYQNPLQQNALYDILDTLKIEPA